MRRTSILNKFSDLLVRALTALVGVFVMIFCVMYGPWTFFVLFLAITVFSIREYARMVVLPPVQVVWLYVLTVSIFSAVFLFSSGYMHSKYLYVLVPILSIGSSIQLYLDDKTPLRSMALMYFGVGYIVLPFSLLSVIIFQGGAFSPYLIVGLLVMIWCMDTGGYFFGSAFGKHKLFERISPKKSWEGALGGVFLVLIAAWVLGIYFNEMNQWQWLVAGLIIAVSGIFGDLVESFIKRVGLQKDSGSSIPGHGGFLDRFDSLIYSIPFFLFFLKLI